MGERGSEPKARVREMEKARRIKCLRKGEGGVKKKGSAAKETEVNSKGK